MRRLTDTEVSVFMDAHPSLTPTSLPPWGAMVQWNNKMLLVYWPVVETGWIWDTYTDAPFISDLTDRPDLQQSIANMGSHYDPATQSMWYYFPQEFLNTLKSDAQAVATGLSDVLTGTGKVIGETAGNIVGGTSSSVLIPIALVAVAIILLKTKR